MQSRRFEVSLRAAFSQRCAKSLVAAAPVLAVAPQVFVKATRVDGADVLIML